MSKNFIKTEGAFDSTARKAANAALGDVALCTTAFSLSSSTTLANVVGLVTETLEPGTYEFEVNLITTAGASGGVKVAFKQSVASMLSSINAAVTGISASAIAATTFSSTTDAASIIAATTAYVNVLVKGVVVVSKAGTLQLQAAQNASNGTATTVGVNSSMRFQKIA